MSGNDILSIIKERRSIRSFSAKPVRREDILTLLEAARWAPTAGNVQPWHFFVVLDDTIKKSIARAALSQDFIAQAPVVVVVTTNLKEARANYGARGDELYCLQDTAAAAQNILLTACSLNLASCWVGAFDEEQVGYILGIERHLRPVAIIPIGYAAEQSMPPHRKTIEHIASFIE